MHRCVPLSPLVAFLACFCTACTTDKHIVIPGGIRRITLAVLIVMVSVACTKYKYSEINVADFERGAAGDQTIVYVLRTDSTRIDFDERGGAYGSYQTATKPFRRDFIHGTTDSGVPVEIAMAEVQVVGLRRETVNYTPALIVVGVLALSIALASQIDYW